MTVVGLVIGMRAKSNMTTKLGPWVVADQNKWVEKEYSGVKFRMSRISYIVDMDMPVPPDVECERKEMLSQRRSGGGDPNENTLIMDFNICWVIIHF